MGVCYYWSRLLELKRQISGMTKASVVRTLTMRHVAHGDWGYQGVGVRLVSGLRLVWVSVPADLINFTLPFIHICFPILAARDFLHPTNTWLSPPCRSTFSPPRNHIPRPVLTIPFQR